MKYFILLSLLILASCSSPKRQSPSTTVKTTCVIEVGVQHEGQSYSDFPKVFIENVQARDCDRSNIHLKANGDLYFKAKEDSTLIARKVMSYRIKYMRII